MQESVKGCIMGCSFGIRHLSCQCVSFSFMGYGVSWSDGICGQGNAFDSLRWQFNNPSIN